MCYYSYTPGKYISGQIQKGAGIMRFIFTEKKISVGSDMRAYAEKKIGKLDKFFRQEADAYVTFSIEKNRNIAEVTISSNGMFYRVKESTGDMHASIDSAVATIERQIRKNKTRLEKRLREGVFDLPSEDDIADFASEQEDEQFSIVRTKRFPIRPMAPEDAILQMNLLGHTFFAFINLDDDGAFSVVYKRKSGGYGLIESDGE